jgi:hypothetical protein
VAQRFKNHLPFQLVYPLLPQLFYVVCVQVFQSVKLVVYALFHLLRCSQHLLLDKLLHLLHWLGNVRTEPTRVIKAIEPSGQLNMTILRSLDICQGRQMQVQGLL